jgi:hypothetical protein
VGKRRRDGAGEDDLKKISIGRQTAAEFFKKQLTTPGCADIINHVVRHGTNIWGISSAGSPVGIKTHPQSDSPATIKFPTKNSIQEVRFLDFMGD